jgi:murein L,D-transpeptidase YafK
MNFSIEKNRQRPLPEPSKPLKDLAAEKGITLPLCAPKIVVRKSQRKLYLYEGDILLKSYPISLGKNPRGQKERRGDGRTPEGKFYICQKVKNPAKKSLGTRWLRISYPNGEVAKRGLEKGLINREVYERILKALSEKKIPPQKSPLGGGIGIHGGNGIHFKADRTAGCIGMYDEDVEEMYEQVTLGTPVKILP